LSRITPNQSQQLDSIRGLSALIVLFGHTNQAFLLPTLKSSSVYVGFFTQFAVMVFFVLSGFLIGKSICNNMSKNGQFSIAQYAKDRALRLYPPLIAAIVLMLLLTSIAPYFFATGTNDYLQIPGFHFIRQEFTINSKQVIGALTFINEFKTTTPTVNGPLWSLPLEVWYYVIAAIIFLWPDRKLMAGLLLLLTVIITRKNPLFFILMPIWFSGLGLAFVHQKRPNMHNMLFSTLFGLFTAGTIYCIWLVFSREPSGPGVWLDRMNHYRLMSGLWFSCALALIMGGAIRFPKIFHKTSGFSYTLYITHFPIILFVVGITQKIIIESLANALIISASTMALAIITSIYISKAVENKKLLNSLFTHGKFRISRLNYFRKNNI
jgi:peptidoglycan/LPS O-acetylase OafA/YrhL